MSKANDQNQGPARPTAAARGREVRRRLLAAAAALISEVGWNAVTTRTLAERAGVRSGLVHYHFDSLAALLRQAALEAMRPALDEAVTVFTAAADPADGAAALLASLDRYTGRDPESLLFTEAYLAATRDEELRGQLAELTGHFRDRIAAGPRWTGHRDPEATAIALMAVLDGFLLHKALNPGLSAARITPLVRGLMTDPPKGEHP
ncbi:TetR family transcriptional regulator [Streptomyces sp. F63]|uniref:TetR/AcrR family transcriptional regulator n=1 Tax=Streptomyces sp. F63 TaxID=2824887 RepID=UPI001B381DB4|nr:TetR family transcriptional regulator [Streptomyces sp. F63]MBQ0983094.1 TetR family transcriptional regulator [Streptomyces sp. F63]